LTTPQHGYLVRRSARARRARLTVTEQGEVVVVLPRRAPLDEAARLVGAHSAWLDRHVGRLRDEHARLLARPALGDGRQLALEGVPVVVWRADDRVAARLGGVDLTDGRLLVRSERGDGGVAVTLEAWLRSRARTRLGERVVVRAPELGVTPGRISVRDQRSRWASASPRGDLSFSWRLVLAPPYVLDAVVVHELAHLRVRGHSRAFWALVEGHAPRTQEARHWLRQHARELRAALD
jgi:predicted metal-dependent hydrolase